MATTEPVLGVDADPTGANYQTKAAELSKPTETAETANAKVPEEQSEQVAVPDTKPAETIETEQARPEPLSLPESALDGKIDKPFHKPLDSANPIARPNLSAEQKSKYEALLKTVSSWTDVPTSLEKNAKTEPITDKERMFLTRECLLRYLRATKWNTAEAGKRLLGTLSWRREYGVEEHTSEYIEIENQTGKQVLMGYDINARPCLYLNPSKQNTEHSPRQIQHLVFMLERTVDLMGPGQETLSLLVNFKETRSGQNATIGQGRQTLYILQNHYPERLGRALVINVPFVIWGFFKLITPFIDPLTREKLKFNEDLRNHVPPSQLLKGCGGEVEFEYDHSVYWPALMQLAKERREAYTERWVKGGKLIGEHEGYLKSGEEKSLSESTALAADLSEKLLSKEAAPNGIDNPIPEVSALKISA